MNDNFEISVNQHCLSIGAETNTVFLLGLKVDNTIYEYIMQIAFIITPKDKHNYNPRLNKFNPCTAHIETKCLLCKLSCSQFSIFSVFASLSELGIFLEFFFAWKFTCIFRLFLNSLCAKTKFVFRNRSRRVKYKILKLMNRYN